MLKHTPDSSPAFSSLRTSAAIALLSASAFAQEPAAISENIDTLKGPPAATTKDIPVSEATAFEVVVDFLQRNKAEILQGGFSVVKSVGGAVIGGAVVAGYLRRRERMALEAGRDLNTIIMQTHHFDVQRDESGELVRTMCLRDQQERRSLLKALGSPALVDEFQSAMKKVIPETCLVPLEGRLGEMIRIKLIGYAGAGTSSSSLPRDSFLMFVTLEDPANDNNLFVTQPRVLQIREKDLRGFLDPQHASQIRVESPHHAFRIAALHNIARGYFGGTLLPEHRPIKIDLPVAPYNPIGSVAIDWRELMGATKPDAYIGNFFKGLKNSGELPVVIPCLSEEDIPGADEESSSGLDVTT